MLRFVASYSIVTMPRKIRQLISELEKAGFANKGGKGMRVTISGKLGDDAKPYQEKEVKRKIEESQ